MRCFFHAKQIMPSSKEVSVASTDTRGLAPTSNSDCVLRVATNESEDGAAFVREESF